MLSSVNEYVFPYYFLVVEAWNKLLLLLVWGRAALPSPLTAEGSAAGTSVNPFPVSKNILHQLYKGSWHHQLSISLYCRAARKHTWLNQSHRRFWAAGSGMSTCSLLFFCIAPQEAIDWKVGHKSLKRMNEFGLCHFDITFWKLWHSIVDILLLDSFKMCYRKQFMNGIYVSCVMSSRCKDSGCGREIAKSCKAHSPQPFPSDPCGYSQYCHSNLQCIARGCATWGRKLKGLEAQVVFS